MTPRKPGRGAETHLGHLREPCRDKRAGYHSPSSRQVGWVLTITERAPCTDKGQRVGCGGTHLAVSMASSAEPSNQRGRRTWLRSSQPGRLAHQAGGVEQPKSRGWKAVPAWF